MATCAFVSFRFGRTDGVSIVARQWMELFRSFGFEVVTVTGDDTADRPVPGLAIGSTEIPSDGQLAAALADADLTVVENLCTIPLNVPAALATGRVLAGRPAIMHHHDPPWHRPRYAHVTELPLDDPAWRHVTITATAAAEMAQRGMHSSVIHNGFDRPGTAHRSRWRAELDVATDELLLAHPVRAIERKNVPAALCLAQDMGAAYWLLGPAEEGYSDELERILAAARCRVIRRSCDDIDDIYAAADAVAYPSIWEGFGNPPIEAALRRRHVAVGHYPFSEHLRALGMHFCEPDDGAELARLARSDDTAWLDQNQHIAEHHFSIDRVRADLHRLLDDAGWLADGPP